MTAKTRLLEQLAETVRERSLVLGIPAAAEPPVVLVVDEAAEVFAAAARAAEQAAETHRLMDLVRAVADHDLARIRMAAEASRIALARHTARALNEESDR